MSFGFGQLAGQNQTTNQTMSEEQATYWQNMAKSAQNVANVPTPPTLVRAVSASDELNKRLMSLSERVAQIASAIGGPFPTTSGPKDPAQLSSSAIALLNERIDQSHSWVTDIEGSLSAIQRSLGS